MNSPSIVNLIAAIVGESNVVYDHDKLAPYLEEPRKWFESRAQCAVLPGSTEEVSKVIRICREHQVPVVPQGGNTGLCGGAVGQADGILMNLKRMNQIRGVDEHAYTLEAEAGCILADIQRHAMDHDLYFPLSLGAEGTCQIGGNLATNAGGLNVVRYGNTRDLTLGLEVVLPDGTVWNGLNALRKNNTGYDLKDLFIGAEGTLGVITAAVLKLFPPPVHRSTAVVALDAVEDAVELFAVARKNTSGFVTGFELMSRVCIESAFTHIADCHDMFSQPYHWYVLIELSDSTEKGVSESINEAFLETAMANGLVQDAVIARNRQQANEMWRLREAIVEAQNYEGYSVKNDISLPISGIAGFIANCGSRLASLHSDMKTFAYGHLGDGNLHYNLTFSSRTGFDEFRDCRSRIIDEVNQLVHDCNGSFSAEHGVGLLKLDSMQKYKSDTELNLMRAIKNSLDPEGIMNPGKVLPPENCR